MSTTAVIGILLVLTVLLGLALLASVFRGFARKTMDENSAQFRTEGVGQIKSAVDPLARDLAAFRTLVDQANRDAIARTAALQREVRLLAERSGAISVEANNLAAAINGQAQVTGSWAEIGLKRVLDLGGLVENVDYTYQETFASADSLRKDLRTDVLVKMPGDRWVVVDSKNTVRAYTQFVDAEGVDRETLKKDIVASLRNHVDELKSAAYGKHIKRAFDYSFMFIPFEEVYLIALKSEIKIGGEMRLLREYALENKVLFINATGLLAVLHAIQLAWQQEDADEKARKVIAECGKLCDKVSGYLKSYQDVGKGLAAAVKAYNGGLGQLATGPGNILKRLQDLGALGIPAARDLPSAEVLQETAEKIPDVKA